MHHDVDIQTLGVIVNLARIREQHLETAAAIDLSISRLRGTLTPASRRTLDRLILVDSEWVLPLDPTQVEADVSKN